MTEQNTYPKVDRSDFTPNERGRMGDDVVDIGWAEGMLNDGRPYHLECWSLAGSTGVTVFMASDGLTEGDPLAVHTLLEVSGVITTLVPQELSLRHFTDPVGTPCVSVSYVVADDDDEYFVEAHPPLRMYRGRHGSDAESTEVAAPDSTYSLADDLETPEMIAMFDEMSEPAPRSPMAEARREAKALARLQREKKRSKRRKFRKPDA